MKVRHVKLESTRIVLYAPISFFFNNSDFKFLFYLVQPNQFVL